MELQDLTAISPIDGRYRKTTQALAAYFSEHGLIHYRVRMEILYFLALTEIPLPGLENFPKEKAAALHAIYDNWSLADSQAIKEIEKTTNHDVKAVEYYLRKQFTAAGCEPYIEFIHFGLTSQDVNNTAIPLSLRECCEDIIYPKLREIITTLQELADAWKDIPMLARTHGQPASPTRLGKEIQVFAERLENQFDILLQVPFTCKLGGATGNFNAHHVAYPAVDWKQFANSFCADALRLQRQQTTTQIEHYDNLAAWFDGMKRINTIFIDFARDIWTYVSQDYFKQKIKPGEVGSSAMPHKVNPIDFENAEGNFAFANGMYEFLSAKLPVSRLQRDLTDSTVLRNLGVPIAHTCIGYASLVKGIGKLLIHPEKIEADLLNHTEVVAEAIQTILRRENYPHPYEALKQLTRQNEKITLEKIAVFIDGLAVSDAVKTELRAITPANYTGI